MLKRAEPSGRVGIRLTKAAFLIFALSCCANLQAQDKKVSAVDPVFMLSYDPARVEFQHSDLRKEHPTCPAQIFHSNRYAIFADVPTTSAGRIIIASTEKAIEGEFDQGIAIIIKKEDCLVSIPLTLLRQVIIPNPPNGKRLSPQTKITDSDVRLIMADTLSRHAIAFGSKQRFFDWIDKWSRKLRVLDHGNSSGKFNDKLPDHDPLDEFTPTMMDALLSFWASGG